jgi:hypothetical protein
LSFRGAIKKGGGGFLNNVDGEIVSYEFTDKFKGETKAGEWCYFVPTIKVDGADDTIDQHLFIGGNDRYSISKDGQELTMEDGSPVSFGFSTPFGRFIDSMIEKGFDESDLPDLEGGEPLELSAIVGPRYRFKQEVDEKANAKMGKRKVKKNGKTVEYDRTNTVIDAVLGTSAKTSSTSAKGGKKTVDVDDEAADVLKDILATGDVNRKNLSLPVTKALMKNANKDAIKAMILSEEWQNEQDWLEADKKGNLSLAA